MPVPWVLCNRRILEKYEFEYRQRLFALFRIFGFSWKICCVCQDLASSIWRSFHRQKAVTWHLYRWSQANTYGEIRICKQNCLMVLIFGIFELSGTLRNDQKSSFKSKYFTSGNELGLEPLMEENQLMVVEKIECESPDVSRCKYWNILWQFLLITIFEQKHIHSMDSVHNLRQEHSKK